MIDTLLDLPSHLRRQLQAALACGALKPPYSQVALRSVLTRTDDLAAMQSALTELQDLGIQGKAASAWIQTAAAARERIPRPELVWTGPEVPGVQARDTAQVFQEMLGTARTSIWASTYAYYDGQKAFATLAARMEAVPSLQVTLLLNIHRPNRNTSTPKALLAAFTERFWRKDWPGTRRPAVYYDPRSLEEHGPGRERGVLHAKALVTDQFSVLVTSANFTAAALERNIELGIKVDDRALALRVIRHYQKLIDLGLLERVALG